MRKDMSVSGKDLGENKKDLGDRNKNEKAQEIYQRIRSRLKGTHAEIAAAMSRYLSEPLDVRVVSNWSTGRSMPTIEQLGAVALAAHVKLDWLVLGDRADILDAPGESQASASIAVEAAVAKLGALRTYIDSITRQAGAAAQLLSDTSDDLRRTA
jgi:transcriptional regulator with XRE-family HTH domain